MSVVFVIFATATQQISLMRTNILFHILSYLILKDAKLALS